MNKLAAVLDRPEAAMAVVFDRELSDDEISDIGQIADVAEFRADLYPSRDSNYLTEQIKRLGSMPVLLTIRSPLENGRWSGREDERLELFRGLMPHVDGLDVELGSGLLRYIAPAARKRWKMVIGSRHYFDGTPNLAELSENQRWAYEQGADYVKLAAQVDTIDDLEVIEDFTNEHKGQDIITVGMGFYGPPSRIRLPLLGSKLTYAHSGHGEVAAGQMDYRKTHVILKDQSPAYAALFEAA